MGNLPPSAKACHTHLDKKYQTLRKQFTFLDREAGRRHANCPRIKDALRNHILWEKEECPDDQWLEERWNEVADTVCDSSHPIELPTDRNPLGPIRIIQANVTHNSPHVVQLWSGGWAGQGDTWRPVITFNTSRRNSVRITPAAASDDAYHVLRWLALEIVEFHHFYHDRREHLDKTASVGHNDLPVCWDFGGPRWPRRGRWHLGPENRLIREGRRLLYPLDHDCETPAGVYLLIAVRPHGDTTDFVVLFLQRLLHVRMAEKQEYDQESSMRVLVFRENRATPCLDEEARTPSPHVSDDPVYMHDVHGYLTEYVQEHGGLIGAFERDIRQSMHYLTTELRRGKPVASDFLVSDFLVSNSNAKQRKLVVVTVSFAPKDCDVKECELCMRSTARHVARNQMACCGFRLCGWCLQNVIQHRCPNCEAIVDRLAGVQYNVYNDPPLQPAAAPTFMVYQVTPDSALPVLWMLHGKTTTTPYVSMVRDNVRYHQWLHEMFRLVPQLAATPYHDENPSILQPKISLLADAQLCLLDPKHDECVAVATFHFEDEQPLGRSLIVLRYADGKINYSAYVSLPKDDNTAARQVTAARLRVAFTGTRNVFRSSLRSVRPLPFTDARVREIATQWIS